VQTTLECGPGKVLSGLIKRIDSNLTAQALETPQDFATALDKFKY
jgi:[acyl-carrier-protein] S-malonyltransferase